MSYWGHKTGSSWSRVWRVLFILSSSISFLWRFPSKLAELDLWIQVLTSICYEDTFILFVIFLTVYQPCEINYLVWLAEFYRGTQARRRKSVFQKHLSKLTHTNKKKHCFDFTSSFAQNFQFLPQYSKCRKFFQTRFS